MRTLIALLVVTTAACAIARPPAEAPETSKQRSQQQQYARIHARPLTASDYFAQVFLPKLSPPHLLESMNYDRHPLSLSSEGRGIYDKQNSLNVHGIGEQIGVIKTLGDNLGPWLSRVPVVADPEYEGPRVVEEQIAYFAEPMIIGLDDPRDSFFMQSNQMHPKRASYEVPPEESDVPDTMFAFSPLDKNFYTPFEQAFKSELVDYDMKHYKEPVQVSNIIEPPRQTRQNPNLHKQKNLLGQEIGSLKSGFAQTGDGGVHERDESDHHRHIHVLETSVDPADSIYGVALLAAVGTALTMVIFGFGFGWYTLSRKAKAAADVDYPAYGVTGPTIDSNADRKLAQSAHMYHYQHQKQQIIAMERNGLEQRNGSISDPESEEENEEGDYTVYECPGFATTGDMEVKNPMFSEEPTPATPGKCEVVKPQPKE